MLRGSAVETDLSRILADGGDGGRSERVDWFR